MLRLRNVERPLNIESFTITFTYSVKLTNLARIELAHIKSMNTNVQNCWIVNKNTSCPFPNMYIPIEDYNFLNSHLLLSNFCCNCSIIKEAKATSYCPMSMMSRGSYNCKSTVNLLSTNCSNCLDCATSCNKCCLSCKFVLISVVCKFS
jgi:hypothetical protein